MTKEVINHINQLIKIEDQPKLLQFYKRNELIQTGSEITVLETEITGFSMILLMPMILVMPTKYSPITFMVKIFI